MRILQLGFFIASTLMGSGASVYAAPPSHDEVYAAVYPNSIEYCGVSQILKHPGHGGINVRGGAGGHGLMYLQGACRDLQAKYPRVRMCDPNEAGERGVGVSVNSNFKNVNWIAVQSRALFFDGLLQPGERVNAATYARAMHAAQAARVLEGVIIHPPAAEKLQIHLPEEGRLAEQSATAEEFMWQDSFGTDFAVRFGRDLYCVKVPVTEAQLRRAVDYLNAQNDHYYVTQDYEWTGVYDNCTHTTHNALAAAGFWDAYRTRAPLYQQVFNLAIPANDWVSAIKQGNDLSLTDPVALFRDSSVRESLQEFGRLPLQAGVLADVKPIIKANDLYETDSLGALFLEVPLLKNLTHYLRRTLADTQYTDVYRNLQAMRAKYQTARDALRPATEIIRRYRATGPRQPQPPYLDAGRFTEFHGRYERALEIQLREIDTAITKVLQVVADARPGTSLEDARTLLEREPVSLGLSGYFFSESTQGRR